MVNKKLIHDKTPAGRKSRRPSKILKTQMTKTNFRYNKAQEELLKHLTDKSTLKYFDPLVICEKLDVKQFNLIKVKEDSKDQLTPIISKKHTGRNQSRPRKIAKNFETHPKDFHESKKKSLKKRNILNPACVFPCDKITVLKQCATLSNVNKNESLKNKKEDVSSTYVTEAVVHVDGSDCKYFDTLPELSEDNTALVDEKKALGNNKEATMLNKKLIHDKKPVGRKCGRPSKILKIQKTEANFRYKVQKELLKHLKDKFMLKYFDPLVICEKLDVKQFNQIKFKEVSRDKLTPIILKKPNGRNRGKPRKIAKNFETHPKEFHERDHTSKLQYHSEKPINPVDFHEDIIEILDELTVKLETETEECDSRKFQNSKLFRKYKLMSERKREKRNKLGKSPIRILADILTSSSKSKCTTKKDLSRMNKTRQSQLKDKKRLPFKRNKGAFSNEALAIPFSAGWKRELVERSALAKNGKPYFDIYYITPEHVKLRSIKEISSYLYRHNESDLTIANFSFVKKFIFCEPLEIKRKAFSLKLSK